MSDNNNRKKYKTDGEGNGESSGNGNGRSTGQSGEPRQSSDQNVMEVDDSRQIGRGRGRGASSSESSGSGSAGKKVPGSVTTSGAAPASIPSEARDDGRAKLFKQRESEVYNTRPETYVKAMPVDQGKRFVANYFRIKQMRDFKFLQYRVDFLPEDDRKNIRRALVANCRAQLRGYVFDGGNIVYVTRPLANDTLRIPVRLPNDDKDYEVTFRKTEVVINSTDAMALQVLNVILRKAMGGLQLTEISRHLYDMNAKIPLPELKLELIPGYVTSIRQHEENILVCTEITHKVMRQENLLQILADMCRRGGDYKSEYKREVIGTIVMTPYNNRTYRVDDVKFEMNPQKTFDMQGREVTFAEYYRSKYKIELRDKNQPLLVSNPKARDIRGGATGPTILIPELCIATGLTDAMRNNFNMMRTMGQHTRLNPLNRAKRLTEFSRRVNQTRASHDVLESFGLEMERDLVQLGGRVLNQEKMIFGNNRTHDNDHTADWTNAIRSNIMFESVKLARWGIIYPLRMERDVDEFMRIFREVAAGQRYEMAEPKVIKLGDDRIGSYTRELDTFCAKDPSFVMVFLPNNNADRYKAVKVITYAQRAIPSQVVCLKTIQPKKGNWGGVKSIATKILLQVNSKLGGAPWMIQMPLKGVMVIGFDATHDTGNKANSFGAFVASMDLRLKVKYFSAVSKHSNGEELAGNIAIHMNAALHTYSKVHGSLPERILFYRDGVGEGQIEYVHTYEVNKIQKVIASHYKNEKPKFGFIIVSKRLNTRFFEAKGGNRYDNPISGTVIDNTVTLPHRYEFFLISQSIREGTVSPTNYNVIHDNFGLPPDRLQQLTYKMTHLYYNWSGTTRVPAVVQYAHKLAILIGQHMHQLPNNSEALSQKLYFL